MKTQKVIISIYAIAILSGFILTGCSTEQMSDTPALKDVFEDYHLIGTAMNVNQVDGNDENSVGLIVKHFNSVTPENMMKWEKIHPEPGEYNFEPVDSFVSFGQKSNMFIVGHTLVWHSQTPGWVFENENGEPTCRDTLLSRMKNHIFTVAGRYKDNIGGWDVVNETFYDDGSFRQSPWYEIIGEDYIEKAFEWAYEAAPGVELYYNDYNMWHAGKRDAVVKLVKDFQQKGIRIDGIGLQGHWGLDYPPMDELEESMRAYSELGVKIMITELDMDVLPIPEGVEGAEISQKFEMKKELNPFPNGLPDSMKFVQADRYAEYFNLFNKFRDNLSRVTFWGIQDGHSWRNYWPVRGRAAYPLLFDRNFQPKPAFDAVIKTVTGK